MVALLRVCVCVCHGLIPSLSLVSVNLPFHHPPNRCPPPRFASIPPVGALSERSGAAASPPPKLLRSCASPRVSPLTVASKGGREICVCVCEGSRSPDGRWCVRVSVRACVRYFAAADLHRKTSVNCRGGKGRDPRGRERVRFCPVCAWCRC